jgi:hypothetical protein
MNPGPVAKLLSVIWLFGVKGSEIDVFALYAIARSKSVGYWLLAVEKKRDKIF